MSAPLLRIAAAQFPVFEPQDWAEVERTLKQFVSHAADQDSQLLVFPEYAAMSLAGVFPNNIKGHLRTELRAIQSLHGEWLALHARLARDYRLHILAGSFPVQISDANAAPIYRNRAQLFAPNGRSGWQDKWTMTRFETELWGISAGDTLKVFDTALGRIAINICYDVEFPLLARAQVEAGAQIILAPSCTDTTAGYWRVRVGAQARALENQCVVVQAPLVGEAPWSACVDVNVGRAGIYTPPDRGLPDDGVLAVGEWNQPQCLIADIDPAKLAAVRADGQVFNHRDWARQPDLGALSAVVIEDLR
ncbi:MAG: carbon-nitrogen hydrolase family protein [Pseudomonadota bacterium]